MSPARVRIAKWCEVVEGLISNAAAICSAVWLCRAKRPTIFRRFSSARALKKESKVGVGSGWFSIFIFYEHKNNSKYIEIIILEDAWVVKSAAGNKIARELRAINYFFTWMG